MDQVIPYTSISDEAKDRFWSHVDRGAGPDACWIWTGRVDKDGYGEFSAGRRWRAHRLACLLVNGTLPDHLVACHNCPDGDNPRCVNPAHIWFGTNRDNIADRHKKGRDASGNRHWTAIRPERRPFGDRNGARTKPERRPRGSRHGCSIVTEQQVVEMRHRYALGGVSYRALAADYGISKPTVAAIVTRRLWSHV